jgi:hypothetical protein
MVLALPALLARPVAEELHLRAPASHAVVEREATSPAAEPSSLRARLQSRTLGEAPGVVLHADRVTYGARWEREVTSAAYVGPFDREGDAWPCDVAVHAGAGLFDTTKSAKGLVDVVDAEVRKRFPMSVQGIWFPAVKQTTLEVAPIAGALRARVAVELRDGTRFTVTLLLALEAKQGVLRLRRTDATPASWSGPSRLAAAHKGYIHWLLGPINDWTMGLADEIAARLYRTEIAGIVTQAIGALDRSVAGFQRGFAPFPGRAGDRVELALEGDPLITPSGVTLRLCPRVKLAAPKVDAAIPGPPRLAASLPDVRAMALADGADGARLVARLSPDAIVELLYVLFQIGALRDAGRSEAVLRELPDRVADLAFTIRGFEPRLPPVARARGDALELLLGDVAIGRWDGREVVGHARFDLSLASEGRTLRATATPRDVAIDCIASDAGDAASAVRIEPCLSDLLPALRGELVGAPRTWAIRTDVLAESVALGPLRLDLDALRASTRDGTLALDASATLVRVEP